MNESEKTKMMKNRSKLENNFNQSLRNGMLFVQG